MGPDPLGPKKPLTGMNAAMKRRKHSLKLSLMDGHYISVRHYAGSGFNNHFQAVNPVASFPLRSTAKWLSLIPVIGGVCLASVAELDFSVAALVAGILANLFAAVKGNENKKAMDTPGLKVFGVLNTGIYVWAVSFSRTRNRSRPPVPGKCDSGNVSYAFVLVFSLEKIALGKNFQRRGSEFQ